MVVGLTGGIATGKSTVSRMFQSLGAPIVDSDVIARWVVEPQRPAWRDIVSIFGTSVLSTDGTINRTVLGELIFSSQERRQQLNQIVHPRIREEAERQIQRYLQEDPQRPVIQDVPLLIETGLYKSMDAVILVYVDVEVQRRRLLQRDGWTEEQADQRIASQIPIEDKKQFATYLIDNQGSMQDTKVQVQAVWDELCAISRKTGGTHAD